MLTIIAINHIETMLTISAINHIETFANSVSPYSYVWGKEPDLHWDALLTDWVLSPNDEENPN